MRIIFVRHGEPNYEKDCLTETGKKQAAAAAKRLQNEGISEIYASPMGRAMETAAYTAALLGLPIRQLDFMHEISWGAAGLPEEGNPWLMTDWMIAHEGYDPLAEDWRSHPYYDGNIVMQYVDALGLQFDRLLEGYGYRHEGRRFLCEGGSEKTIAVFSHGGSGSCVLAHLLSLPFPYVTVVLRYGFTSVTVLELPVHEGQHVFARLELFNEMTHTLSLPQGPEQI